MFYLTIYLDHNLEDFESSKIYLDQGPTKILMPLTTQNGIYYRYIRIFTYKPGLSYKLYNFCTH